MSNDFLLVYVKNERYKKACQKKNDIQQPLKGNCFGKLRFLPLMKGAQRIGFLKKPSRTFWKSTEKKINKHRYWRGSHGTNTKPHFNSRCGVLCLWYLYINRCSEWCWYWHPLKGPCQEKTLLHRKKWCLFLQGQSPVWNETLLFVCSRAFKCFGASP